MGSTLETRIRHVTAVLGPTNTGKTHLAIERMLGHESGMIGLPLRLLAREVYDKIGKRIGFEKVALVTGEEKIKPENARYWVSTVEAMPRDLDVAFLAIDEVQLAADPERGHVFTDRMLNARGREETLLLGAQTMREAIADLIPGANFISRPRLSKLTYSGEKKITRLPKRSAVVAFSANEVYSIAELVRRQSGGAAVVLGALSPRTRNAQVELYQSGDVDFLVATDAIGMGLNLDVDHVAFAAIRKFDGYNHRDLTPAELSQIAGRAGRHMNDGTFGVTGSVDPFEPDVVERLETHNFDAVRVLQWRNTRLDFSSLNRLLDSLREAPNEARLVRARDADDVDALELLAKDEEIRELATGPAALKKLWDVCQVPDYRKISTQSHADLVGALYRFLRGADERIPEDWFAQQVNYSERTDGDIDTLSNRIAHVRTWTFVANRSDWLKDPAHWQEKTRAVEDRLSDALHQCLLQRFVDKRTSALMKGMRDKEELNTEIGDDGRILVENHYVGQLSGFRFAHDAQSGDIHGKAARLAAGQVLQQELSMRARRVAAAKLDAFKMTRDGRILWRDEEIGRATASDDPLRPAVTLLADEHLSAPDREKVQSRLDALIGELVSERLKPLLELAQADDVAGLGKGIAFQLRENFGILKREDVAQEIRSLDQPARAQLRKYGVRFGAFNIYFPLLLKPAAAELGATLWALKNADKNGLSIGALPEPPRAGLTSTARDEKVPEAFYRSYGYHVCGTRAVRFDILERLADQIRPLLAWRNKSDSADQPPKGSTGDGGFIATPEMMSILGCAPAELHDVLNALGFSMERRPAPNAEATAASESVKSNGPAVEKASSELGSVAADDAGSTCASATASDKQLDTPEAHADNSAVREENVPVAVEQETTAEEEDAKQSAGEPAQASNSDEKSDDAKGDDAPENYIEVWRPRRHKPTNRRRNRRKGGEHRASSRGGKQGSGGAKPGETANSETVGKGRRKPRPKRPDAGRAARTDKSAHRAGDAGKRGAAQKRPARVPKQADPDSPFAALGALKEALERGTEEKSSS